MYASMYSSMYLLFTTIFYLKNRKMEKKIKATKID